MFSLERQQVTENRLFDGGILCKGSTRIVLLSKI